MTFEIPFDSKIAIEQYALKTKLTFKKNLTGSIKLVIYAGIIIFLGWLILSDKNNISYIFFSVGLFYLFNAIHYFRYYIRTTKKLKAVYSNLVEVREKSKDLTTWSFGSDAFRYKDIYYEYSIKWEAFKGYKIIQNNLFLMLAETIDQSYIIGEKEVGEANFAMIVAFVKEKLKDLGE